MAPHRGNQELVSEAIPLSRSAFFAYLSTYKSLREVAVQMSLDLDRKIAHQSIMDALDRDAEYQEMLAECERIFALNWPMSATEGGYCPYHCMHNSFRKNLDDVLFRHRFHKGWPSADELAKLFVKSYPVERWEKKTAQRELLRAAGVPVKMKAKVLEAMRMQLRS